MFHQMDWGGVPGRGCFWAVLLLVGCNETYCQRGPKYGTQCYSINEVEWQETQVHSEPPPRTVEPAPGCVTVGTQGVVQQPLPHAAPSAGVHPPRGRYLMSGACVSDRVPAYGAVR